MKAQKLIEVAMPIKEISAESVRDKSIRHGHISTLHLWWARRPLPTCRAVVFASLVPDPLDENCPQAFRDAVEFLLKTDGMANSIYAPYPDIPYTAVFDPMEDNHRNRLLMFIGKFSAKCQKNMLEGKTTSPKEQIQDGCLIKWESKNSPDVLMRARKLIWVAYNSEKDSSKSFEVLSSEFDSAYGAIKEAEDDLYNTPNRHLATDEIIVKESTLQKAIDDFQSNMPSVFDPFAGGGAIPLEAARLGCHSYGNDINPVAHIIEKGSVEFPQKYGKPITYAISEFKNLYGEEGVSLASERGISVWGNQITLPNRLSFDVEFYSRLLIDNTQKDTKSLYPNYDKGTKPVAYYWARVAKCSNPSCGAEVPLLGRFWLANTSSKKIYLNPIVNGNTIDFEIKKGSQKITPWVKRAVLTCPCCGSVTTTSQLKEQYNAKTVKNRLIAVIEEKASGKTYRLPNEEELSLKVTLDQQELRPSEKMQKNSAGGDTLSWGVTSWGDLYSDRQILMLNSFVNQLSLLSKSFPNEDYYQAVVTYLAILIDRIAIANTSYGLWHTGRETLERILGRQAISIVFDYPESYPFCESSGSAANQLSWLVRYIESESTNMFSASMTNASSGEKEQFERKTLTAVVTDPPYYDAIAYADISDIFYVWLKRTLGLLYPLNFATPQTPKAEECTALKHHHNNDADKAKLHFENKLLDIFKAIEEQTSDVISIMFAHQSTEAWTTLCNSILGAKMNIMGSWAMDTEMQGALKTDKAFLESSVTVACRPAERNGYGSYKKVKKAIQENVAEEVRTLYELGFRGADLLTACFGKAVSEFGNYEAVEKADGSEVTVAELLDMARTAAFTALLRDFDGDDYTKFYIGWLQLNGMGETDFDDATKFTRVGMNVNISEIFSHGLLVKDEEGNKQHLCSYKESQKNSMQVLSPETALIDKVHQTMWHWADGNRQLVLKMINEYGSDINNEFWRVFVVLKELLPVDCDDAQQVNSLLSNSENLIRESKEAPKAPVQATLFDMLDD
ncbi:DUF1156 domain-containing protein [Prevotellamassilia timonensis]|uniref:DUF1156 domain-containing protein n=1 Tax=Prevotellamassilia timonensis TaxID=1852370 RepID=UPI001F2E07A8|nr:DUF1156 domain-containing protein [Prevotellamassilia timonensis]MCF2635063.1 DUF1156 domain-containing protein [Prevotellamassilia timonensis]